MTLIEALDKGLIKTAVDFYYISRSIFCKNEYFFDLYDIAFANYFKDASLPFSEDIQDFIVKLLNEHRNITYLLDNFEEFIENLDTETLKKELEQLMQEQDEIHNFGNKWIGSFGTSKFGNSGINFAGFRIDGAYGMENALRVAEKRVFKDYRNDLILNTRTIKVALKRLRKLEDIGKKDELNVNKTIHLTCKNGGDIELVFEKKRKNAISVILLTDVGGTMDPYIQQVNLLFSAANSISHWKDFQHYYFHNCIYNRLYENAARVPEKAIDFEDFLIKYKNYRIIIVGDQTMHRSELTNKYGAIYDDASNKYPGIYYLNEIAENYRGNVVWLSPELEIYKWNTWTQMVIAKIIPTFPLSIHGIEDAMDYLRDGGKNHFTSIDLFKNVPLAYY
ncbi:MAG: VWA containing CoxE family protein [Promethearchaeota archaeon]